VELSVKFIKLIWHGNIGRTHNRIFNIKCRFHPSCSNYAILALEKYGFFKGWILAIKRLCKCTKWIPRGTIDYP